MVVQQVILYMMNPIIKIKSYHGKQMFVAYNYRIISKTEWFYKTKKEKDYKFK